MTRPNVSPQSGPKLGAEHDHDRDGERVEDRREREERGRPQVGDDLRLVSPVDRAAYTAERAARPARRRARPLPPSRTRRPPRASRRRASVRRRTRRTVEFWSDQTMRISGTTRADDRERQLPGEHEHQRERRRRPGPPAQIQAMPPHSMNCCIASTSAVTRATNTPRFSSDCSAIDRPMDVREGTDPQAHHRAFGGLDQATARRRGTSRTSAPPGRTPSRSTRCPRTPVGTHRRSRCRRRAGSGSAW